MRRIYLLSFLILFTFISRAQTHISFEENEGYELGSIHQQMGWEVTESDADGFIQHQVISDEQASDGEWSFKNGYEPDYDWQFFPIFGATQLFDEPIDYTKGFTISYDILVTEQMGSDFEFVLFGTNEDDEWSPIAGVGTENRGFFYFTKDENYDFEYAESEWIPNEWNNIKVVVTENEIEYYINDNLEYSLANFSHLDIQGFNMLHNNYGADAYYDNFVYESGEMGVSPHLKEGFTFYPNPVDDMVHLKGENLDGAKIGIYSLLGQEVLKTEFAAQLDLSDLEAGIYILQITKTSGESFSQKLIKK